jgi:hypothetical protein
MKGRSHLRRARGRRLTLVAVATLVLFLGLRVPGSVGSPASSAVLPASESAGGTSAIVSAEASLSDGRGPTGAGPWACAASGDDAAALCSAASLPSLGPGNWTYGGPGPQGVTDVNDGEGNGTVLMVYDPTEEYVLVVAGDSGVGTATWSYAGGVWTVLAGMNSSASAQPTACSWTTMAYDPSLGAVILVEPYGCPDQGETWSFAGGAWVQLHPATTYPIGYGRSYGWWLGAVPPAPGILLFEPDDLASPWSYANGTWSSPKAPSSQSPPAALDGGGTLAYDSEEGALIDFLAYSGPDGFVSQTWAFRSGEWSEISTPAAPSPRSGEILVDDPADGYLLLVGGYSPTSAALTDVWSFASGNWSEVSATNPLSAASAPIDRGLATPDPQLSGVLTLFVGAQPAADEPLLWSYHDASWTNVTRPSPPPGPDPNLVYDPTDGYDLLLTSAGTTWTYSSGTWTEVNASASPPAGTMTYDASSGYVVLFGQGETWEYVGGLWAQLTPAQSPPNCAECSMAYDPLEGAVVLAVGYATGVWTWEFANGTWTNMTPGVTGSPPGGPANPIAYDAALGGVVLFGTYVNGPSYLTNETWLFAGHGWSELSGAGPPPRWQAGVAFDPASDGLVLFGGATLTGTGTSGATWTLEGTTWSRASPMQSPPPRAGASLAFAPSGGSGLLFGGGDQPDGSACVASCGDDWWTWTGSAAGTGPWVLAVSAEPNPIDSGAPLQITTRVQGGTAPLSYMYTGLPRGCESSDLDPLSCTPAEAGSFQVNVTVSDALGNRSEGSVELVVNPPPTVEGFVSTPSAVSVGVRTLLEVTVTGGVAPYTYSYSRLPTGCLSQDVPILPCVPQVAGSYSPSVLVLDGQGVAASAVGSVTVTPAGASGAPSITAFTAVPATFTLGNGTTFTVSASEGGLPLSYSFAGVPPGCTASNRSVWSCVPSTAGAYVLTVAVTDPSGHSAEANLTLDVAPAGAAGHPSVDRFVATPAVIPLGNATLLVVQVSGNSAGESYVYSGLPGGCASLNSSHLACRPRVSGSFVVLVTVSGPLGNRTAVPTTLRILAEGIASAAPSTLPGWVVDGLAAGAGAALVAAVVGISQATRARYRRDGERWLREIQVIELSEPPARPPSGAK